MPTCGISILKVLLEINWSPYFIYGYVMSIYLVQNYIYFSVMKPTQALLTPATFACSYIKMVHYCK